MKTAFSHKWKKAAREQDQLPFSSVLKESRLRKAPTVWEFGRRRVTRRPIGSRPLLQIRS